MPEFDFGSLLTREIKLYNQKTELLPINVISQHKKKISKIHENTSKTNVTQEKLSQNIDQKLNDIVNERILKLIKIGLNHELTMDNLLQLFKEQSKLKLYNLTRYFSTAKPIEVETMLKYLFTSNMIKKDKNGWYSLRNVSSPITNMMK